MNTKNNEVEFKSKIESKQGGIYRNYIKRVFDLILSLLAIIVLSPVFLILFILIRIILGSPVIFKQKRPGFNEKIFTMYKFRTMTDKRDEHGEWLPDSQRITKFGKILRTTSLDELPGLFNILKGEMSFVGPRPLSIKYLPYYNEFEKNRHSVRPGLTGLSQVNGRNEAIWEQRFAYDIEYIENISFIYDLKIIFKTVFVVLKREGIVTRGTGKIENFHEYRIKQNMRSDKDERNR